MSPGFCIAGSIQGCSDAAARLLGDSTLPSELQVIQMRIDAIACQQLSMSAGLRDAAILQHHDTIRMLNRGEPVRNDEGGTALHQPIQRSLHRALGFSI